MLTINLKIEPGGYVPKLDLLNIGFSSLLIILSHFSADIVLIKSLELKDGFETIDKISPFVVSSTTIEPDLSSNLS